MELLIYQVTWFKTQDINSYSISSSFGFRTSSRSKPGVIVTPGFLYSGINKDANRKE